MALKGQLQNSITDSSSIYERKLYLSPYMDELIKRTHSAAIHRYESKALIIATNQCACYCQFCTRQRITRKDDNSPDNFKNILNYIRKHSEIMDVLITGGDPFILSTRKIINLLKEIEKDGVIIYRRSLIDRRGVVWAVI